MYQELQKGWIEVICGPMFAGKSEELIRRVKTLSYAHQKIVAFKPAIDNRYDKSAIASHDGEKYQAFAIKSAEDILSAVKKILLIGFAENQSPGRYNIRRNQTLKSRNHKPACIGRIHKNNLIFLPARPLSDIIRGI